MVSIIIPCYNYGHFIGETINSLLKQSYQDFEIIVINDGSIDNTQEIVNKIAQVDKRVFCHSFPNSGLGTSRNRGITFAKGEFVQFLDADDLIEKNKFEEQVKLFSEHPEADVVYGSVRYFRQNPYDKVDRIFTYWGLNKEWMPKLNGPGKTFLPKALKGNFSHLSSPLFRKSIIDKVGLFDNEISAVADYHFLLRCTIDNAFFYYHDTPGTYSLVRWHPDNMSKDPKFMRIEEIKMRYKITPLLEGNKEAIENNAIAIKGLTIQVKGSWRRIFLSGGPFDFLKKWAQVLGLKKVAQKIFYK